MNIASFSPSVNVTHINCECHGVLTGSTHSAFIHDELSRKFLNRWSTQTTESQHRFSPLATYELSWGRPSDAAANVWDMYTRVLSCTCTGLRKCMLGIYLTTFIPASLAVQYIFPAKGKKPEDPMVGAEVQQALTPSLRVPRGFQKFTL